MTTRRPAALGIDVGTTEVKAGIVTLDGELLGLGRRRHATNVDAERGTAEQDPEAWWTGVRGAVADALEAMGDRGELVGVSVDGHGPTLVPTDAAGIGVRPAITWQDRRAIDEAAELADATGRSGWGLGILPAARWLERHEPAAAARTRWYLNTWEALGLRLSGRAAAVVAGAAEPVPLAGLRLAGLAVDRIPDPVGAGEVLGGILPEAARILGLPAGLPVVAGVVDAYASLHGARMLAAGDAIDVGGAAGGFGLYWDRPIEAIGSFTAPAPLPGLWLVGGAMAATGAALDWFATNVLAGTGSRDQLLAEAADVPAAAGGLVFLPYLAGERSPIWNPEARGAFVGLTVAHGRGHLTRAILEAAAFALRHVADGITASEGRIDVVRVCGGPAASPLWNRIKADVLDVRVEVPRILETAVVGSAILATTGVGAHPDLPTAIRAMATIDHAIEPDPAVRETYDRAFEAYLALYPALESARAVPGPRPATAVATGATRAAGAAA
jgi:xylulokinase